MVQRYTLGGGRLAPLEDPNGEWVLFAAAHHALAAKAERIAALEAEWRTQNEWIAKHHDQTARIAALEAENAEARALLNQALDYFAGHGESYWARTLKDNIRGWLAERALRGKGE